MAALTHTTSPEQNASNQTRLCASYAGVDQSTLPHVVARELVTFLIKADGYMMDSARTFGVADEVVDRLQCANDPHDRAAICEEIRAVFRTSQRGHTGRFFDLRSYIPIVEQVISESQSFSSPEATLPLDKLTTTAAAIGQIFSYTLTYSENQAELGACLRTLNALAKLTERHFPAIAMQVSSMLSQAKPLDPSSYEHIGQTE